MRETHPYNLDKRIQIPEGTRTLIIGTAPPPRFSNPACGGMEPKDFDFFYGSWNNNMWQFLCDSEPRSNGSIESTIILDTELSSGQRRNAACIFLKNNNIWMRDVLQEYERKPGKECCSAADRDIDIISPPNKNATKFTNFAQVCAVRSIVRFAFTSEKAAEWTFKALERQGSIGGQDLSAVYKAWNDALDAWKQAWKENSLCNVPEGQNLAPEQISQLKQLWLTIFNKKIFSLRITFSNSPRDIDCYLLPTPANYAGGKQCLTKEVKQEIYQNVLF